MMTSLCSSRVSATSGSKDSSEVNLIIIVNTTTIFIIVNTIIIIIVIILVLISMITSDVAQVDFPSSVPPSLMDPVSTQT